MKEALGEAILETDVHWGQRKNRYAGLELKITFEDRKDASIRYLRA